MEQQDYIFTDDRYGREITITGPAGLDPMSQQMQNAATKAFNEAFGKDLIFDSLLDNEERYIEDMKASYKQREGKAWKGNDKELLEQEFEYWNWVDNNLTATGTALATGYFEDMDKEQKQRMLRLYDIYDRTQAFGEGSRDFWEQFKGVGGAVALDPANWFGGYGALSKLLTKSASKGLTRKILEKVMFPSAVGATWAGTAAIEKQEVETDLEKRINYDWGQVGESTKAGAVMGPLFPAGARFAGRTAEGAYKVGKNVLRGETVQSAKEGVVRMFGGAPRAKTSVIEEASTELGLKVSDEATGGRVDNLYDIFNKNKEKIEQKFKDKYSEYNFGKLTVEDVNALVQQLSDLGIKGFQKVDDQIKLLGEGKIGPTEALQNIRRYVSNEVNSKYYGKGYFEGFSDELADLANTTVKNFYRQKAKESGQTKALELDAKYSKWLNYKKNSSTLINRLTKEDKSQLISTVNMLTTNPKTSGNNFDMLMKTFSKLETFSKDKTIAQQARKEIMDFIKADLVSGREQGKRLENFLLDKEGVKTLKKLFPGKDEMLDDFSVILKNAQGAGTTPLWLARFMATGLAFSSSASKWTGAFTTGLTLKGLDAAVNSKGFRKLAMDAFRNGNPDERKINGMVKWLEKNTEITPEGLKAFRQQMLGGVAIVGSMSMLDEATSANEMKKMPFIGEYLK